MNECINSGCTNKVKDYRRKYCSTKCYDENRKQHSTFGDFKYGKQTTREYIDPDIPHDLEDLIK